MMRRLVPLVISLLSLACGNEPTSPSSSVQLPTGPPLPPGVPNGPPLTMRGGVWDTTNLPISVAQVQVVAPTHGTVAVTDENGQFLMPWPFTGTVTVRASKEGFTRASIPCRSQAPRDIPCTSGSSWRRLTRPSSLPGSTT